MKTFLIKPNTLESFSHVDLTALYGRQQVYVIDGDVPPGTVITAAGDINVLGSLMPHAQLQAKGAIEVAGYIYNDVTLRGQSIQAERAGDNCTFEAQGGGIDIPILGDKNHLRASGKIEIETAGTGLNAKTQGSLHFNAAGDGAVLSGATIDGGSVGRHSRVTSTQEDIRLSYAAAYSAVYSATTARIINQGSHVHVSEWHVPSPHPQVLAEGAEHQPLQPVKRIIYDAAGQRFLIPRDLPEAAMAAMGTFVDAVLDAGGMIKDTAPSDTRFSASIACPSSSELYSTLAALVRGFNARAGVQPDASLKRSL